MRVISSWTSDSSVARGVPPSVMTSEAAHSSAAFKRRGLNGCVANQSPRLHLDVLLLRLQTQVADLGQKLGDAHAHPVALQPGRQLEETTSGRLEAPAQIRPARSAEISA